MAQNYSFLSVEDDTKNEFWWNLARECRRCVYCWCRIWPRLVKRVWHQSPQNVKNAIRPLSVCVCLAICLSVCDVGVLWPNWWMDQDETWHGGWPYCVRWGPSSPKEAQPPNFRPMSVVAKRLDGSRCQLKQLQLPPAPPTFWPMSIVAKQSPISATAEHLLSNTY